MKVGLAAVAATLLWIVAPASAHRLDEYLQATTIAVEKRQITVQMRLTPGAAVARTVLAEMDTDGDGTLSDAEQRAYAARVLRDISLTLDGSRVPLALVSFTFPSVVEMKEGLGDILLSFSAGVPAGGLHRKLAFGNHFQGPISAYLVNCLSPNDPDIRVTAQSRNYEQSSYQVDYRQAAGAHPTLAATRTRRISTTAGIAYLCAAIIGSLSVRWCWRRQRFGSW